MPSELACILSLGLYGPMADISEQAPLLGSTEGQNPARDPEYYNVILAEREAAANRAATIRAIVYGSLTLLFGVALVGMLFFWEELGGVIGGLPKDPLKAALVIMDSAPVIVSNFSSIRSSDQRDI